MSDEFLEKKSKGKIFIILFIILFILSGIGIGGYFIYKNLLKPEKFLVNINNLLNTGINNYLDMFKDDEKDKDMKFNGTASFSSNTKELDYFNHMNFDFDILSSFEKEEIQTNIKFNEDQKNIFDGDLYIIKDSIYLNSSDLYDKILLIQKMDSNIFEDLKNLNDKNISITDVKDIINSYINYLFEALKEAEMKSELVDIYKIKWTYEINENNLGKVQNKYDELIKNDKKIQLLIKNNQLSEDSFKITFIPVKMIIIKSLGTNDIYKIEFKSKRDNFLLEKDEKDTNLYHLKYNDITGTLDRKNDTYTLKIYENEVLKTTIKITLNENLFRFIYTEEDVDISFTLKEERKEQTEISLSIKGNDFGNIDISSIIKKISHGYDYDIKFDYKALEQDFVMRIKATQEFENDLLTKKDISSSVDINSLSEYEQNKIYEKLYKKLEGTKLIDLLLNEENSL